MLFLASGFKWIATDPAPPVGRENFLGGGTFSKALRLKELMKISKHSYRLLFSFLHSNNTFIF